MKEIKKKIVAMVAVVTMMMSYVVLLGEEVYAAYEELEAQGRGTNQKQVELDVYFVEGEKEVHSKELVMGKIEQIRIKIGVKEGYLKGGQISLKETNYKLVEGVQAEGIVKSINVEEGKIELNDIEKDQEVVIELPIEYKEKGSIVVGELNKESKVGIEGTYVDSNGKERKVEGEKKIRISWRGEAQAFISNEQEKYIQTEEGMILVRRIKVGVKDNTVGVRKEIVEVRVPEIEGKQAEEVKVIGRSLRGSKKEERAESFGKENYEYRKEEGKVRIEVENKETEEGRAAWGEGNDEFIVVMEYKEVEAEGKEIEVEGRVEIEGYGVEGSIKAEEKKTEKVEKKGQLVSGEIEGSGKKSKGYLYANNGINGVEYTSKWIIEVDKKGERVEVEAGEDRIVTDKEEAAIGDNGEYKRIEIDKRGIEKIIGETGKVEIYNEKGEKIGEVGKESVTNETGKVEIEGQGAKGIKLVVEEAQEEGILYVENVKEIKSKTNYNRKQIEEMRGIKTEQTIGEERKESQIELTETESRARVEVNPTTFSTIGTNEKVEIVGILQRNGEDCDLYENPTIQFIMPKEVTGIELVGVNVLYSSLKKVGQEVKEQEDGRKVIEVRLEGEEKEYSIGEEEGTTVQVVANVTLDRKETSKASKVEMRYTNEKAVRLVNGGVTETGIEIVAPSGLITVNSMKGYNGTEEVSSMIGKAGVGKLEVGAEARRSEVGISVINNNTEKISNVRILGRVPYEGNKEIVSKQETGSTIDTKLVKPIEGAEVYYSENGEADSDRNKEENGWTKEANERTKSYLIEVGEIEAKGEREYGYEVEVPGGLGLNEESYGVYGVYYNNEANGGKQEEIEEATKVGVSTGQGPVIEGKLTVDSGEKVNTMQPITYRVSMTNTGKMTAENVKVQVAIPEGLVYAEEINDSYSEEQYRPNPEIKEINLEIGNIEVGETITRRIVLLPIIENANVKLQATITADNLEKEISVESVQTQIIKGAFRITEFGNNSAQTVALGEELIYCAYVKNDSNQTINRVVATTKVDDWLEYQDAWFVHDDRER